MKRLILFILFAAIAAAQSFTIDSPTANQAISGFAGFPFKGHATSAPSAYCVTWQIDAYVIIGSGCVRLPNALSYNTFYSQNGNHVLTATLRDAHTNILATATQNFSVANTWPVNPVNTGTPSGMSVATGTALTSNWSGSVSITPTFTGESATVCKNVQWFVDGNIVSQVQNPCTTGTSPSFSLDTTKFYNGTHIIAVNGTDTTGGITYTGDSTYIGGITEWSATVTFANTSTIHIEVRPD